MELCTSQIYIAIAVVLSARKLGLIMTSLFEQLLDPGRAEAVELLARYLWGTEFVRLNQLSSTCYNNLHPVNKPGYFDHMLTKTLRCNGSGSVLWNRSNHQVDMDDKVDRMFRKDCVAGLTEIHCLDSGSGPSRAKLCDGCGTAVCNVSII